MFPTVFVLKENLAVTEDIVDGSYDVCRINAEFFH